MPAPPHPALSPSGGEEGKRGFTLIEVLVALTILGLAVVALMQLSSQGLRLLGLADDYQQAVRVADRVARETPGALQEGVEIGREGRFRWERRVALVPVPEELAPGTGPKLHLYALSVAVRWGRDRVLELASLRAVSERPAR